MELYIDLEKGRMNTAKLVKKPVQVRGKNGKIYTRMQWVDPRTGQPVSEAHSHVEEDQPQHRTQKEHIDHHVKKMSREDKYRHIEKHGIKWKPNAHPSIDHKNAVEALKQHLYKNPHLAGAEHLPEKADLGKNPDGTDNINDFASKYKKHPELLYKMMHHLGVIGDHTDPRTVPGKQSTKDGGDGMGAIEHMRNLMAFKKHLKENPHHIDEMKNHPEFGAPHDSKQEAKVETPEKPKTQSKAQKGGNTIKGVLDSMSREEKYKLCKHLGIADTDPLLDASIDEKMRPIHHMRNMMALKKEVEKNPHLLNIDPDGGGLSTEEQERIKGLEGKEKSKHDADAFLKRASRDLKLRWAKDYADHEHMKSRIKSDTEHIDNMHKIAALKKILIDDPSIMDELEPELQDEELLNLKIGNKMMGKILREVVGLKGIGDVMAGFEKGKQWEFGVASTAEITTDDEGEPILSVVDAGKDGEDFNEIVLPLKKVKAYIDGLNEGKKVEVAPKEVPLHKKAPQEIWKALNDDFKGNYTKEVGDALKLEIAKMWEGASRVNSFSAMRDNYPIHVNKPTLVELFKQYGLKDDGYFTFDSGSDAFKRIVYGHKIEKSKSKSALDYLEKDSTGRNDTWVLHESAKHWSPDQRVEARKEFLGNAISIHDLDKIPDGEDRKAKLISHLHTSLEHVPFDLMTDVMARGLQLNFHKTRYDGTTHMGNFCINGKHNGEPIFGIWFDHNYVTDSSLMDSSHPLQHRFVGAPMPGVKSTSGFGGTYSSHPLSDTAAHEFAHAIDAFLSGGAGSNKWLSWDSNETGKKYAGKHANVVEKSYTAAVNRSNPNKAIGMYKGGNQSYAYHKDEWMSTYEGRIYDRRYYTDHPDINPLKDKTTPSGRKMIVDSQYDTIQGTERGLEHWTENVSRYANAQHAYKMWKEYTGEHSTDMDSWAERMAGEFTMEGYGDDSSGGFLQSYRARGSKGRNENPMQAYGYLYHTMKQRHPELHAGIMHILDRPDFIGDNSVAGRNQLLSQGDYARKSDTDLIINL